MQPLLLLSAVLALTPAPPAKAPPPGATLILKGQSVPLPSLKSAAGTPAQLSLLVSAKEDVLRTTLARRGWTFAPDSAGPTLGVEAAGLRIDRANQRAWLWKRKQEVLGVPLWAVAVGGPGVEAQGARALLERDLQSGLSAPHKVTGAAVSWLELQAPPDEGPAPADPSTFAASAVVSEVPITEKKLALTFDACSTLDPSRYDERVIAILEKARVPATLFIGGRWAEEHPEILRTLAANPQFEIGNHTYSHPHMADVPPERIRDELSRTQKAIFTITGKLPTVWRPPYGEYSERVVAEATRQGLTTVEYEFASGDPDPKLTPEKIAAWVNFKAHEGSIVVMHMNRNGKHTFEALPEVIRALRARGYTFVTVTELMHPAQPAVAGKSAP